MLAIRMQRTGRKGHATFRVVVQDSRLTPTSGRFVAQLGHYDPHTKSAKIDSEKATYYLSHGAQPSQRVARLMVKEGVALPDWFTLDAPKERKVRNAEKLRSQQPKEEVAAEEVVEAPAETEAEATPEQESPKDAQED